MEVGINMGFLQSSNDPCLFLATVQKQPPDVFLQLYLKKKDFGTSIFLWILWNF